MWEAGGRKRARDWLFSVFMLYVAWERGFPRKFTRFVLFRPIKKRSFNLLCVLGLFFFVFFQNAGSQLCFRFFPPISFRPLDRVWSLFPTSDLPRTPYHASPAVSPSRGGDVVVDAKDINQPSLLTLFFFFLNLFLCLFLSLWPFQLYFIP